MTTLARASRTDGIPLVSDDGGQLAGPRSELEGFERPDEAGRSQANGGVGMFQGLDGGRQCDLDRLGADLRHLHLCRRQPYDDVRAGLDLDRRACVRLILVGFPIRQQPQGVGPLGRRAHGRPFPDDRADLVVPVRELTEAPTDAVVDLGDFLRFLVESQVGPPRQPPAGDRVEPEGSLDEADPRRPVEPPAQVDQVQRRGQTGRVVKVRRSLDLGQPTAGLDVP